MLQLIVSDMDGTLLNDKKQLPAAFWEVEADLFKNNILFGIASGRQFHNLHEVFERIKHRMLFIADNGAYVFYKGTAIIIHPLPLDAIRKLINTARKIEDAYTVVSGLKAAYIENTDPKFLDILYQHYAKVIVVPDLTQIPDVVLKITICDFKIAQNNSYLYFKAVEHQFRIAVSGTSWLDINHIDCNKGNAIQKIQEQLDIVYDQTAVFGDYLNDLEMMTKAKWSYAMKNAHPEILKAATFITLFDNNENGVLKTIQDLVTKV
jgi:Cof subfamily protein (haloacid dehalogenase superfamily)